MSGCKSIYDSINVLNILVNTLNKVYAVWDDKNNIIDTPFYYNDESCINNNLLTRNILKNTDDIIVEVQETYI